MNQKRNDTTFMNAALGLAQDSHCVSKQVGCVIVANNRIVSSGVNGTPVGYHFNCDDLFSKAEFDREEHHQWSLVHELHAETNAFMGLVGAGVSVNHATLYVTLQPCTSCATMIVASGIISRVVYHTAYDKGSAKSLAFLKENGIIVEQFDH